MYLYCKHKIRKKDIIDVYNYFIFFQFGFLDFVLYFYLLYKLYFSEVSTLCEMFQIATSGKLLVNKKFL